MGQSVSSIIDNLEGKEQQEKEANDALNALMQMATDRQTLFYEHISSPAFDPGLVPMSKVIYNYQNIQCGVSNSAEGISSEIADTLGNFIGGDVAKGVTNIVSSCLSFLFGNYSANTSSTTMYTLTTGSLGGLARIDTDFYSYEYTSDTLTSITKNVLVCSIVISSADVTGLNKNDISTIVQTLYSASAPADQVKIRDQLWEAVPESTGTNGLSAASVHPLEAITFEGPSANVDFKDLSRPVLGAVRPVDSIRPVEPVEPRQPDETHHEPGKPDEPVKPGEPIQPVQPVIPVEPVPVHPVEPIEPVHPVEPIEPMHPGEPVVPVEPVHPIEPLHPVEPVQPIEPIRPVEPVHPVDPAHPVEPAQPDSGSMTIRIATLPGKADTAESLIQVYLFGYLKGKSIGVTYDIDCSIDGTDEVSVTVKAMGDVPEVDDLRTNLQEAMEQFMMTKNCPARSWEFVKPSVDPPHPVPEPQEPDEADINIDITKMFKQLNANSDASLVTTQLITYIIKSLGDFKDLSGAVDASTVASAIYDCIKGIIDAQVIASQAHVVQWLIGGLTYYTKNNALPTGYTAVIPLSLPGARSDGAEKLLSSLMAFCSVTAAPASPGVVMFVNLLTSAKVVKPSFH